MSLDDETLMLFKNELVEAFNQDDELVCSLERTALSLKRDDRSDD